MTRSRILASLGAALLSSGLLACGDSGGLPGISLGAINPSFDAQDLAEDSAVTCATFCNGDFGSETVKGGGPPPEDNDLDGALAMFVKSFDFLDPDQVDNTEKFLATVARIEEGTFDERTFNATQTMYCNSDGLDLGDPGAGWLRQTLVWTASFDNGGNTDPAADQEYEITAWFHRCRIEADFLNTGSDQTLLLDGEYVFSNILPATPSGSAPRLAGLLGQVEMESDLDGDEVFENGLWGEVIDLAALYSDDGADDFYDGGLCIGSTVLLGGTSTGDADDGCGPPEDGEEEDPLPEGFAHASYCGILQDC